MIIIILTRNNDVLQKNIISNFYDLHSKDVKSLYNIKDDADKIIKVNYDLNNQ